MQPAEQEVEREYALDNVECNDRCLRGLCRKPASHYVECVTHLYRKHGNERHAEYQRQPQTDGEIPTELQR